jgi:hypothetical protein
MEAVSEKKLGEALVHDRWHSHVRSRYHDMRSHSRSHV